MKNISNVFVRTVAIWTPSFITNLIAEKRSAPTWFFWFFWNILFSVLITALMYFGINLAWNTLWQDVWPNIESQVKDFEITLKDGEITTSFDEPIVLIDGGTAFVLDTELKEYTPEALGDFTKGVFITKDRIIHKYNKSSTQELEFSYFQDFIFHTDELVLRKDNIRNMAEKYRSNIISFIIVPFSIFMFLFLCVFRLLSALIWALLFWMIGIMWGVKKWSFGTAYLAVLNLYLVALILSLPLLFLGISIPFSTFIIFMIFFNINFYNAPREITNEETN